MTYEIFDKLSHFTYKEECENKTIRKVQKGEEYHIFWSNEEIEEDAKYKLWIRMAFHDFPYIAKEDRWYSGDGVYCRTVGEVIDDWNGHIRYSESEDKFYNKAWIQIHYLDGNTSTKYFDTEEKMLECVESLKKNMDNPSKVEIND